MNFPPVLSIMIFMPLVCAFMVAMIHGEEHDHDVAEKNIKHLSFFSSVFVLVFSFFMYVNYDVSNSSFQFVEHHQWFGSNGIQYHLGVDGISIYFILLTTLLIPICILASWGSVAGRLKEYMISFLVLESLMIGAFCALDSVLFYVFFEGVLIPMFLIIGIWGGSNRIYASYKFFLYTFFGSVFMFLGLLALYALTGTTDMQSWMANPVAPEIQKILWLAFFASFAVKLPMWPFHTWLPDAHVEAPTAGSVILAGVLLKMGGYGFLRFSLPMFPDASLYFAPFVMGLSVIAILYASLVALVQEDMKKLIAYSSVAHMGFVTLGLFSFTPQGIEGAVFQMISHGLISAALFLCVGALYRRLKTREIKRYGGIVKNMPNFAVVFMVFTLGAIGLPGTSGFIGEFLTFMGAMQTYPLIAAFAGGGLVLGAAYMLLLYRRLVFGPQDNVDASNMKDLEGYEKVFFLPLLALVIYLGIYPNTLLDKVSPSAVTISQRYANLRESGEYGDEPAPSKDLSSGAALNINKRGEE
ncbi:MAG: NADH-quinone oxidoreductase subunit M [Alphaproteobacteria bacterium]